MKADNLKALDENKDYDSMSTEKLENAMKCSWIGQEIYYFDTLDSTNNQAKMLAESKADNGALVVAEVQTNGRGRRGRAWESPTGSGVWMSLILKPEIEITNASMLTLVMAIAVAKACNENYGMETLIKWPNDIVADGKKICGILTEMSVENNRINHIVIGIGINVNTLDFPSEIEDKATSIYKETKVKIKRAELINAVMEKFEEEYALFMENQNLKKQLETYNRLLANKDKRVRVFEGNCNYTGVARRINEKGELLVEKDNGEQVNVYAGEVSVRGIYGYV